MTLRAVLVLTTILYLQCTFTNSLYTKRDAVKQLDPKSFRELVKKDPGIWLVEFYAPWCGHCKNLAPEWKKAAKALDGVVNVAAVDCDQHKDLAGQFGVQGFPTIKIFGADKSKPADYQGARSASGIVDAALAEARKVVKARLGGDRPKKNAKTESKKTDSAKQEPNKSESKGDVVTLTDDNFYDQVFNSGDVWLVEFYAPWCGHCKKLAPEWEQAASDLKGSVKVAALDATAHQRMAQEFGIQGYPTIKMFGPTASSASDATDYKGPRTAADITNYGFEMLEKLGGGLKIKELTSADVLNDFCIGKSSCVIALLPHITDGGKTNREGYLKTLEDAAKEVRGKPFKFGWIQGGDQVAFENQFGLTFGYPSLVAVNIDRKRFVVQRGAFSTSSIASFLQGVLQGKEATLGFDTFPVIKTVDPWDGNDVKVEVVEEDFDDDDIMSEILSGDKDEL